LLTLLLLAQSMDSGRSRAMAPNPSGAHIDRHIDAHIAPREGTPGRSPSESPSRDSGPEPAVGTGAPQEPSPPAIQLFRDPLYRDRRF
jgi:hypothetical protein